jgi:hypothetical protein
MRACTVPGARVALRRRRRRTQTLIYLLQLAVVSFLTSPRNPLRKHIWEPPIAPTATARVRSLLASSSESCEHVAHCCGCCSRQQAHCASLRRLGQRQAQLVRCPMAKCCHARREGISAATNRTQYIDSCTLQHVQPISAFLAAAGSSARGQSRGAENTLSAAKVCQRKPQRLPPP